MKVKNDEQLLFINAGSEYGPDGKPKSYSSLSTAEAEKYNINGAEAGKKSQTLIKTSFFIFFLSIMIFFSFTGYKAATTTLENDGKVSTYSMHTP